MTYFKENLSPKILGQLLLMQSVIGSLPNEESIFQFVCKGLVDIPGVEKAAFIDSDQKKNDSAADVRLRINIEGQIPKELHIIVSDPVRYAPYATYIENFRFMLNVLLEERNQRKLNEQHKTDLEKRVQLRTRELEKEILRRKKIETALHDSLNLFRKTFEHATIGMCLTDTRGVLRMVNPAMAEILGYTVNEMVGSRFIDYTHEDDKELSMIHVRSLLSGKQDKTTFEKRYIHKTGGTIWVKVGTFLLRDEKDKPHYFVTHIEDITLRKTTEQERLALEEQLRQSQKMEAIGTLAGGIAHDFNNLLSVIIGYTEMARVTWQDQKTATRNMGEVLKAANRAKDLVSQILTFSRKKPRTLVPVKIHKVVEDSLKLLRATIPAFISFKLKIEDCGYISGDSSQISQIIMNLCTNASQAMERDGGALEVGLTPVALTEAKSQHSLEVQPGRYACLTVSDTGSGIEKEHIDRIFDPYFTTKEIGKGSGMGLSVVLGAIRNHHGFLEMESEAGKGTVFKVYLPQIETEEQIEEINEEQLPTGTENILVVDDDQHLVELMQAQLERLGYTVTGTTFPQEALKLFTEKSNSFDLVITDQTMPFMTGDVLSQKLIVIHPTIPIIICSGFSSSMNAPKAREININAYLMKPVETSRLAKIVRDVLDHGATYYDD